jgi:hypothetical protein
VARATSMGNLVCAGQSRCPLPGHNTTRESKREVAKLLTCLQSTMSVGQRWVAAPSRMAASAHTKKL